MEQVIDACERAFAAYSSGATATPLRVAVEPPGEEGVLLAMPCAVVLGDASRALGTKIVSVFRGNAARGLPTITSTYLLSDYETGAPVAIMDGTYLTGARTAAGSAVATRHLARPQASSLGVFGTGVQARFHVEAIRRVRPLREVLVAGTSREKADDFCAWVRDECEIEARAAEPGEAAAADVVALCTTSPTPVLDDQDVQPGAHLNAVGAFTPATREMPTGLVTRARVYVDSRNGAFSEAGDLLLPMKENAFSLDRVVGEIGEVVGGRAAGRRSESDVTVYKSVGAAFLDAATAALALDRAIASGTGARFQFS